MIRIVSYEPGWATAFEVEAGRLSRAVGAALVRIHHIGSTAVPGAKAKPVIDILLEVTSLQRMDAKAAGFEALGYEAGAPDVRRQVACRDYLRAHPSVAEEYGALKEQLVRANPGDSKAYVSGKDAFVKEHERRALLGSGRGSAVAAP